MLLTLKPPAQNGIKGPHEYSIVRQSIPTPRSSPPSAPDPTTASSTPTTSAPQSRHSASHPRSMDSSRRGLPPPSSMTLPPPDMGRPAMTPMTPMSQLPPPPPQWQSPQDDSMRHWLHARAEEDRRKQEEEKTRQETLRLEQRRIEQSILRDSLQAGVPPHMIPLIFAGISGTGSLPQSALELAQQYMAQLTPGRAPPMAQRQPSSGLDISSSSLPPPPPQSMPHRRSQSGVPVDLRRDTRAMPSNPYGAPQPLHQAFPAPGAALPSQPLNVPAGSPSKQPLPRPPLPSGPPEHRAHGSRIHTTDMQTQHPLINLNNPQYAPGSSIPPPPHQPVSVKQDAQHRQSSPSIYFHHWVPPAQSQQNFPTGKHHHESTSTPQGHSHRRPEHQNSPGRKRKAQGPHQPAPVPSSRPLDSSTTSASHAHRRQRSDVSYESRAPDHLESEHSNGPSPIRTAAPNSVLGSGESSPQKGQNRAVEDTQVSENTELQEVEPSVQQPPSSEPTFLQSYDSKFRTQNTISVPSAPTPSLNDGDELGASSEGRRP